MKKVSNIERGSLAISQIIILTISLIAFSYFVGAEFKVVSAADICLQGEKGEIKKMSDNQVRTQSQINSWCKTANNKYYCISTDSGAGNDWRLNLVACPGSSSSTSQTDPLNALSSLAPLSQLPRPRISPPKNELTAPNKIPPLTAPAAAGKGATVGTGKFLLGIVKNAAVAASIYVGVRFILGQIGASPELANSAALAASAGYSVTTILIPAFTKITGVAVSGLATFGISLAVAAIIFFATFKQTKYKQVLFTCYPWDAPTGGKDCEKCNTNTAEGGVPCTEYQCKSLGQACELVNKGTTEELCLWKNRADVKPPVIQPWEKAISLGYKYIPDNTISPPDRGVKIVPQNNNTGCVAPFSNISFGVTLDEPARCKLNPVNSDSFEDMEDIYFGGSSTSKYNHSQMMRLPSPEALASENITLINGGRFTMYVRCEDANGNQNTANFVFNFCVDDGPDTTPPLIVSTSILNGMPIAYNQTSVGLQVYVNEPSECKWSRVDQNYADMENQMTCSSGVFQMNAQGLYQCSTTLTGLRDRVDNDFYFRCKDQPHFIGTANESKRNTNTQSYKFTLKGTEPLVINEIKPNGTTIKDSTDVIRVKLEAKTSAGYKEGRAICSFSNTGEENSYVEFFNTDSYEHSQDLFLSAGNYNYNIRCVDLGGNTDSRTISFKVETDTLAPTVVRVFRQENSLKVITNEEGSQCVYGNFGCDYLFSDGTNMSKSVNGTEHSTAWDSNKIFYIKCADQFGNQPFPNQCNIVAKPFEIN